MADVDSSTADWLTEHRHNLKMLKARGIPTWAAEWLLERAQASRTQASAEPVIKAAAE